MPIIRAACLALGLAGLSLVSVRPAEASQEVVTINTPGSDYRNFTGSGAFGPITVGYQFTAASPFTVDALGYYDPFGVLMSANHQVGLFSVVNGVDSTTAVVSATVSPADALAADDFRYAAVTPITLSAGTYDIAGFTNGTTTGAQDSDAFFLANVPSQTVASGFTYGGGRINFGSTFAAPNTSGESNSYYGANLEVSSAASPAPEPSQVGVLAVMTLGLGGLLLRARRQHARPAAA